MSAAVAGSSYSLVHGRPIRPLPKRRLRSRLSEDASAALFGPSQQPTTPLFYFPYNNYAGDTALGGTGTSIGSGTGNHNIGDSLQDSSDEEDNSNASVSRGVGNDGLSATEGAAGPTDSYEWSENTNNKKKRKIPTPANSGATCNVGGNGAGGGGSQSSSGFSLTPISTPRSRWKSSGSAQRSPLSTISSANHASLRRNCRRYSSSPSTDTFVKKATKSSGDEPVIPSKTRRRAEDSGNLAVLPPPPKQTQFTFVCESPVSTTLAFSTSSLHNSTSAVRETVIVGSGYQKSMHTIGTQTSPISNHTAYPSIPQQTRKKPGGRAPNPRREYAFQQQRRRRQETMGGSGNNNGENWVCEFCEYEMIFGEAPEALIRQYEMKDRKERRKMAEKRRLLEKAKQKGKKHPGKNSGKKGGGNTHHNNSNSTAPPPPPPPSTTDSQGTQSDNTPLASASQTPALRPQRHSQQVQTESYMEERNNHVSTGRGAGGGGGGTRGGVSAGGIGSVAGVNSGGASSL